MGSGAASPYSVMPWPLVTSVEALWKANFIFTTLCSLPKSKKINSKSVFAQQDPLFSLFASYLVTTLLNGFYSSKSDFRVKTVWQSHWHACPQQMKTHVATWERYSVYDSLINLCPYSAILLNHGYSLYLYFLIVPLLQKVFLCLTRAFPPWISTEFWRFSSSASVAVTRCWRFPTLSPAFWALRVWGRLLSGRLCCFAWMVEIMVLKLYFV